MKTITTFALLTLVLAFPKALVADGISFFEGTVEEAKALAAEEGKIIFVDAYTAWCGPCKRMSKSVFPQSAVGEYYNANFVNLKLDMEKGEGRDFQKKYRVTAFPTFLFLDPSGKIVHRVTGGMDEARFIKLGQQASGKGNVTSKLDSEYEEGNREPQFMADYIKAKAKAGKPVIKLANEYINANADLTTEASLQVLLHGATEADSRVFQTMVKHKEEIVEEFGQEAFDKQVTKACDATVVKAIEFRNVDLVEEAIDKHKRYHSVKNANYPYEARLRYYGRMDDAKNYLKNAKGYAKIGDAQRLSLCKTIMKYMRHHPDLVKAGEGWSLKVAENDPSELHYYIAAQFQFLAGNHQDAQATAKEALTMAEENRSKNKSNIESLIRAIDKAMTD